VRLRGILAALAAVALLATAGCGDDSGDGAPRASAGTGVTGEINVFAAASLTGAFERIGKDFQAANPRTTVTFNYAGTFHGMAKARPFMTWNGGQLPELTFNVRHKIIDGNRAAVTWDETGKTIRGDDWSAIGVDVYRVEGDQIVEMTCYSDTDKVARLLDPYPGP